MTRIRRLQPQDRIRWELLWGDYCRFYGREPDAAVTAYTWNRMMDESSTVKGIVAVDANEQVVGIANYLLHENTSTLSPVCYLQDLFVDPSLRARGTGKQLLDWLVEEMKSQGWSRLYWATKENNYRARGLYDQYTPHSGFLRYVLYNDAAADAARR